MRAYLEERIPDLKGRQPDSALVSRLKSQAAEVGHLAEVGTDSSDDDVENAAEDEDDGGDAAAVLFEESHILDFWQEIAARDEVLKLIEEPIEDGVFMGFSREPLLSYLRPVVLVDGQHRLRGALQAAADLVENAQDEIEKRVAAGEEAEDVESSLLREKSRTLPISLLLSDDPAEQVFQFVVVNQKATPIGRALLGTIVSTTLSSSEMEQVATRLKNAGIALEDSQAVTYLVRHPDSPFYGLVERGLAGDAKDLLQWNVFSSLIKVFRDLRGGKLYHQRNDYADIWRSKFLADSQIVSAYDSNDCNDPYQYWQKLDGPWRSVFIQFWSEVRDFFGNTSDPDKHNYWGRPRTSNLFNKISLTILAADFFQYLVETRSTIESAEAVSGLVGEWLEAVSSGYFDKDWKLSGVKKDSTGIRKQWANLWSEYRKSSGGQLPDRRLFSQAKGE